MGLSSPTIRRIGFECYRSPNLGPRQGEVKSRIAGGNGPCGYSL